MFWIEQQRCYNVKHLDLLLNREIIVSDPIP